MPEHRILTDEHISKTVVKRLNSYGIDVISVNQAGLKGSNDSQLSKYAKENKRSILTRDDDFRKLAEENKVGVILQTKRQTKKQTASDVIKVLNRIPPEQLQEEVVYIPWK